MCVCIFLKVLEKKEIIRNKAIRQCKEEVRIQVCTCVQLVSLLLCACLLQLNLPPHPYITQAFVAWQSKNDLYISKCIM